MTVMFWWKTIEQMIREEMIKYLNEFIKQSKPAEIKELIKFTLFLEKKDFLDKVIETNEKTN